jgi:type IV pilus assembly protein PilM
MAFGPRGAVGLDIGATAVRVAHLTGSQQSPSLAAFGQVALPPGVVVDGEVRDPGPVSEAVAQLYKRTRIKNKNAIVGIANQRVVVRQVDLPYLEESEFRESLRFQAADYIPMPVEEAELDFILVDDYTTENQDHMMRVLLVAAATETVDSFVTTVSAGGVNPIGVDLVPFAVARAVSASARGDMPIGGSEAVIDVGGGVTNIIVHHNGEPRFVRILLVGGDDATSTLSEQLGISFEEAEAVKLDLGRGVGSEEARRVLRTQVDSLVDDIRGSLDYYLSQEDSEPVASIIMTGGGSLTFGLRESLEQVLRTPIAQATPLMNVDTAKAGLNEEQLGQLESVAAAAVGLALGALPA